MTAHVVDRLHAVVAARPTAVAIATAGEAAFTYAELWERACAIAERLRGARVVAIYMEKSPELVAAMVGAWIAGAAWVPILPELPEVRRTAIVDEVGATHVVVATDRVPDDLRARSVIDARLRASGARNEASVAAGRVVDMRPGVDVDADRGLGHVCSPVAVVAAGSAHDARDRVRAGARNESIVATGVVATGVVDDMHPGIGVDGTERVRGHASPVSTVVAADSAHDTHHRVETDVRRSILATDAMASARSEAPPAAATDAERSVADRAYIIYTSGSTGRPKGVVVSHRGIVPLIDAQIAAFDLRPGDRCLWMLSPSFDASVSDVFTALLAGATLHIEHPARLRSAAGLVEVLRQRAITHVDLPPSLLPLLPVDAALPELRTIVIGGEVCAPSAVRAWASRVRVVNVYGPTETTVCSTLCICDPAWARPLLGSALPGTELRVVDDELWIGGVGVADGYVASPELEVGKFVTVDGARWFRTGDRVVVHPDGGLEIAGRIDRQIKLRGVLVAPEEIEARLREHPAIVDAIVVAERQGLRDVLVAYCEPRPDATRRDGGGTKIAPTVSSSELRAHLVASLDRRLLPRRIVLVESLPRTASGKVDAVALTASVRGAPGVNARTSEPRLELRRSIGGRTPISRDDEPRSTTGTTAIERLTSIWRLLFGADVAPSDHFFDLGGDSFDVIELLAMAELAGLELSAEDVYDAPVLVDLARRADQAGRSTARSCDELVEDVAGLVRSSTRASVTGNAFVFEHPRSILLTGATGFLGAHVLAELLRDDRCTIACLVRATDDASARARTRAALAGVHDGEALRDAFEHRVRCIAGDLAAERFGIGDRWDELAHGSDTIVHCAAEVSVVAPYARLRAANVGGTARVLELAATGRPKRLHYASTLSVFVGGERRGVIAEDDALESAGRLHGGYAQSKWAAEWLVRASAREAAVYRFGLLTGDTRDGRGAERDWLTWFVRGLAAVGAYPAIEDARVDLTPIDHASRAMARLVLDGARGVFHVANPRSATLREIVEAIRRAGVRVDEVSPAQFAELVVRAGGRIDEPSIEGGSTPSRLEALGVCRAGDAFAARDAGRASDAFAALLGACRAGDAYGRLRGCDVFQASDTTFDTGRTEAIAGSCPEPSAELLDLYVARMLA